MRIGQISAIAAGGILLGVSFGCVSQHQYAELEDKVALQKKMLEDSIKVQREMLEVNSMQQKKIVELCTEMRAGFGATSDSIKKLTEKLKEKPESDQDKLVAAAVLLAKRGPNNSRYNAINALGYIGGPEAETALLKMLDIEPNYRSNVFRALMQMNSSKLRELVIKTMKNPTGRDFNTISSCFDRNNNRLFTRKDIPLLLEYLNRIPLSGNYSHYRSGVIGIILSLDTPKGIELVCQEVLLNPSRNNNIFYQLNNRSIMVSIADWKKVLEALGPICSANLNAYQAICQAIRNNGDIRMTDIVLPWADYAAKNSSFKRSYLDMLINFKDPKAAPVIVKMQDGIADDYMVRRMKQCPGIVEKNGKLVLVDKAEMEKLMAQREKTITRLNALDKKRASLLKKTK